MHYRLDCEPSRALTSEKLNMATTVTNGLLIMSVILTHQRESLCNYKNKIKLTGEVESLYHKEIWSEHRQTPR